MHILSKTISINAMLSIFISTFSVSLFANEYDYSHENWHRSVEAHELNEVISGLKKDECGYSGDNLSSCNNHLGKIKNLFDGTKLNQKSLDYIFKKGYEDKLNGTNMDMTLAINLGTDIVDAAIEGKQHYFERILRSSKFLEIENSDHLHASQFTEMKNHYFTNKSIRSLFVSSTCRLESYFMMGGSGQSYVNLRCYYELGSNYLTLLSDLIGEVEDRIEEISAN